MDQFYHQLIEKLFQKDRVIGNLQHSTEEKPLIDFQPFITISRDPGSGGKPIGKIVASKLGFDFYNKKLLNNIARDSKARREIIEQIDEKQRSKIEDLIHNVLNPEYVSERRYIKYLCKVVLSLAQKGQVVILDHGSNFITPRAFGLHVRITAPYRVCVSRAVQYEKVHYRKAREIIRKVIAEREGFVKQYFGKDISNPKYYDLVLNTTYMSMEDAAETIITAFKRKFPQA